MNNGDLLGRTVKVPREIPALVADRIDARVLSLEDQAMQRANAPRPRNLLGVIARLEAEANDPEATPHQREQRLGFAALHRQSLTRQSR